MSVADIFASAPAIGSIGNALNAYANNRAVRRAGTQSTEQLRQAIERQDQNRGMALSQAMEELTRSIDFAGQERGRMIGESDAERQRYIDFAEQQRLNQQQAAAQEIERQQMYARAGGDAFADSLGQFNNFDQRMGDASSQIADLYKQFLQRKTEQEQVAQALAPAASGPTADREAAARAQASQDVMGDAARMANVQGFGELMGRINQNMGGNEQLAALLQNFARGSAGAGQAEIDSQVGNFIGRNFQPGNFVSQDFARGPEFITRNIQPQNNSMLGDMFVGLAGLGNQYMQNRPAPSTVDYSLTGGAGGTGLRTGGGTGLVTRSNLGIR